MFRVAPMPEPVSRYQLPLDVFGSMPACCHSFSSALWVPESSAREAKGACLGNLLQGVSRLFYPRNLSWISRRADNNEIVIHDGIALHAPPVRDEFLLIRLRVHQYHITIAFLGILQGLPSAHRDHAHLDSGLPREDRQNVLEK